MKELLLEQIILINKKFDDFYKLTGKDFNIFKAIEKEYDERTHQNFIVNLLKYKKIFLQEFIKLLKINFKFNFNNINIYKEFVINENKRIDLLLEDGINCVAIEMKTLSTDHDNQIDNYFKYLKENYKKFQFFYLTLNGEEAQEEHDKNKYISISFLTIYYWIEKCIQLSSDIPYLREALIQYKIILEDILRLNISKEDEMNKLINNTEKIKAAHEIYLNYENFWKSKIYYFYADIWDKVYENYAGNNNWRDATIDEFPMNKIWCKDRNCEEYKKEKEILIEMKISEFGICFVKEINKNYSICVSLTHAMKWHGKTYIDIWIIDNNHNKKIPKNKEIFLDFKQDNETNSIFKELDKPIFFSKNNEPTFEIFDQKIYNKIINKVSKELIEILKIIDNNLNKINKELNNANL